MNVFDLSEEKKSRKDYNYLILYVIKSIYENDDFDLFNIKDNSFFDKYDFVYEMDLFLKFYKNEILKLKQRGVSLIFAVDEIKLLIENDRIYEKQKKECLRKFLLYEGMTLDDYVKQLFLDDFIVKDFEEEHYKILSLYGVVAADEFLKLKEKYCKYFSKNLNCSENKNIVRVKR